MYTHTHTNTRTHAHTHSHATLSANTHAHQTVCGNRPSPTARTQPSGYATPKTFASRRRRRRACVRVRVYVPICSSQQIPPLLVGGARAHTRTRACLAKPLSAVSLLFLPTLARIISLVGAPASAAESAAAAASYAELSARVCAHSRRFMYPLWARRGECTLCTRRYAAGHGTLSAAAVMLPFAPVHNAGALVRIPLGGFRSASMCARARARETGGRAAARAAVDAAVCNAETRALPCRARREGFGIFQFVVGRLWTTLA